jgi:flagellar assembly factor FliW
VSPLQAELVKPRENSPVRLKSSRFGELKIPSEYIWNFPEGLAGLRDCHRFALINPSPGSDTVFMWLQSVDRAELALPVMNPLTVFPDYIIRQDEPDIIRLGLDSAVHVQVLSIVRVPVNDPSGITANLAAPIILHPKVKLGWQVILERGYYRVAQPLFGDKVTQSSESHRLVSVGTTSPSISVLKSLPEFDEGDNFNVDNVARIRLEEVVSPQDSVS